MQTTFHNTRLPKDSYSKLSGRAHEYVRDLEDVTRSPAYARPESALAAIRDTGLHKRIKEALAPFKKVSRVILVGIGGSSLGTEAVYAALRTRNHPALTVLDSVEGEAIDDLTENLKTVRSAKEIAIVIISKSGATMETMLNASAVMNAAKKRFGTAVRKRVICVGEEGTPFSQYAHKEDMLFFEMPSAISGRYSVFSAAGIVPLMLLGVDTNALRTGALKALTTSEFAAAANHAAILAQYAQHDTHIFDFFAFNERLKKVGFWYRQLLAESLGKSTTRSGEPFTLTLLPTVSTAVDLHSMAQLYLSGKRHMFTRFVTAREPSKNRIPSESISAHLSIRKGHTYADVRSAIIKGVHAAYDERTLPYAHTELRKMDAQEIGFLLASLMSEVMCLAYIFDVNAFDQPNVESYKRTTASELA